jgi:uncharacterized protein (DUF433 family)
MIHHSKTTSTIQKTRGVCGGEACIRTTRYTVAGLVQWRRLGLSDEKILGEHPDLTQADLDAAWDYYECNAEEIDAAIKDDEDA